MLKKIVALLAVTMMLLGTLAPIGCTNQDAPLESAGRNDAARLSAQSTDSPEKPAENTPAPEGTELGEAELESIVRELAEYHAAQFTGKQQLGSLKLSDAVLKDLAERERCISEMAAGLGAKFVASAVVGLELGKVEPVEGGYIMYSREIIEVAYKYPSSNEPEEPFGFAADHSIFIANDGTVLSDHFSERDTTGFVSASAMFTTEELESIVRELAEYHAAQFTGKQQLGSLKLSDEMLRDLSERERCIQELAKELGAEFVEAEASFGLGQDYPCKEGWCISFTEFSDISYKRTDGTETETLGFATNHSLIIAEDGTLLSDTFDEKSTLGFVSGGK